MTARAIGVFALVLAMASPALAGPANSTIGAKKLEEDMVHSGGVGYPSMMYEWWNKGKGKMDWGLSGELVYGDWLAAHTGRFVKIGLGVDGMLRWNFVSNKKPKVQNDFALLVKPGILIAGNRFGGDSFTFGIKGEIGLPFTIDVHERVTVVTGGFLPIGGYINNAANSSFGEIPILIRLGVEIDAADNVAPWFFFDLGPGIRFGNVTGTSFAWRLGAGTAFWGVLGKNKNKSDSSATASSESAAEPVE
jgi:hypothetical protein